MDSPQGAGKLSPTLRMEDNIQLGHPPIQATTAQRGRQPPEQPEQELESDDYEPDSNEEELDIQPSQQRGNSRRSSVNSASPADIFQNPSSTEDEVAFKTRLYEEEDYADQQPAQMKIQEFETPDRSQPHWEHTKMLETIAQSQEKYSPHPGPNRGAHRQHTPQPDPMDRNRRQTPSRQRRNGEESTQGRTDGNPQTHKIPQRT